MLLKHSTTYAVIFMVLSMCFISSGHCVIRILSVYFTDMQIFFLQYSTALLFAICFIKTDHKIHLQLWQQEYWLLLLRALFLTLNSIFAFYALRKLPLSECGVLFMISPLISTLAGIVILRETLTISKILSPVISFIGILLTASAMNFESNHIWPILSSFCGAISLIIGKFSMNSNLSSNNLSIALFRFMAPISLLLSSKDWFQSPPICMNIYIILAIILLGIFVLLAQVCLTYALKHSSASYLASFSYSRIIFSSLLGYIFFSEVRPKRFIGGLVLIFISLTYSYLFTKDKKQMD